MRLALFALLAACGATGSPPHGPPAAPRADARPAKPRDPHAAVAIRAEADQALHEPAPLDYERPFTVKAWDRGATTTLFVEACSLGDKHACIVAAQLATGKTAAASYRTVAANCRAGDTYSCRALPPDEHEQRFPDLPGAMSRRSACRAARTPAPCDVDALRRECLAGFPAACIEITSAVPEQPDAEDLLASMFPIALRGCRAGIASECQSATGHGTPGDRLDDAQRLCDLSPMDCIDLALERKYRDDAVGYRDNFERACQYGGENRVGICEQLAAAYVDGTLEEPVPGRGQALLDWACPRIHTYIGPDYFMKLYPACAHAKP